MKRHFSVSNEKLDPYKILNIDSNSTQEEIKKAYVNLVKENHPDKVQEEHLKQQAVKRFEKIQEAFSMLSDPEKRKYYDAFKRAKTDGPGHPGGQGAGHRGAQSYQQSDVSSFFDDMVILVG